MPLNLEAKKGAKVLAGVTDPDYQGEIGQPLHKGRKKEYVCNAGDPL